MIHALGTEFVHFYLVEESGELTLVDAGCRGYRPMLESRARQSRLHACRPPRDRAHPCRP